MKSVISTMSLLAVSSAALAHPGHDHASVMASFTHVAFFGGIAATIAVAVYFAKKSAKKSDK